MVCSMFFLCSFKIVRGQVTTTINSTVQISVCGNQLAEDDEECDNSDLKKNTCQTLGYSEGTLTCDISCSFDTSKCVGISTSYPSEIPIQNASEIVVSPVPTSTQFAQILDVFGKKQLPQTLRIFDIEGVGVIKKIHLSKVVQIWVDAWKKAEQEADENKACDINSDKTCNISDFSILLYYIEP